ncbi:MAG: hypothetical protein HZB38_08460 [Planctomycetes bacterium]|nr:hypothetical protein [Planctomycetota bacterium]
MSTTPSQFKTCDECGATIYPEHIETNAAGRVAGKLLCPHCLAERRPGGGGPASNMHFSRPMLSGSPNATRCRTFHAKLADAALSHLDEQINQWADAQPDVEIKFATTAIGVVEGKHADPHLIVTVFY